MPVKTAFNQSILLPSGNLYPRHVPTRNICIQQQWPGRDLTGAGRGIPTPGPIQVCLLLLPQRSGSLLRLSFLYGQAMRADLSRDLLPAFWQDPGGASGIFKPLLLCSRSLLHCQLTWHRPGTQVHAQPLGQGLEFLFMLLVALTCQGCHEK